MIKVIFKLAVIGLVYFLITFLCSFFWGMPPFYQGITVGYPTIYYRFYTSTGEAQHGVVSMAIYYNILIILLIYLVVERLKIVCKKRKLNPPQE
jgi:hypothetical protein